MTPGATRAGRRISERFRKALPLLPESNAETLALIIDEETGASQLLKALKLAVEIFEVPDCTASQQGLQIMKAAIEKAEAA